MKISRIAVIFIAIAALFGTSAIIALAQSRVDIEAEFTLPPIFPTSENDLAQDRFFVPGRPGASTIGGLAGTIGRILTSAIIPLLFIVGTVMLIWGIISYFVINAANEEKRKDAKNVIIWGIVGLFLASAIGGLILLLRGTFQADINTARPINNSIPRFEVR